LACRWLRSFGAGYADIPAAGHEGAAAVAHALRPTDPALLHHRAAAFYCVRAARHGAADPAADLLRGAVGSAADPGSGGRRGTVGNAALHLVPTTGRHAGHLPGAVGVAYAIAHSVPARPAAPWPDDAVAVATFDADALAHGDALVATGVAGRCARDDTPLPLLFVCEDSGAGPPGWVEAVLRGRPGVRYAAADGADLPAAHDTAAAVAGWVRQRRRPAVLHLRTAPLLRPGGAAHPSGTPTPAADPLVATATLLVETGLRSPAEIADRYDEIGWRVRQRAEEVVAEAKLADAARVAAPLAARRPAQVARAVAAAGTHAGGAAVPARAAAFGGEPPEDGPPLTLAGAVAAALTDLLLSHSQAVLLGVDLPGGGASRATAALRERFGPHRVLDPPPDEVATLGLALGAGLGGLLPVCALPHLDALHRADGQLRGQAAALGFLSAGALRNPLVVRVPGLARDPRGRGLPADDLALGGLRDIPGLVVAVPARAADAVGILRSCLTSAAVDGSVCVVVEPAALYQVRDLHAAGDGGWTDPYPAPADWAAGHVPVGRARTYHVGSAADLTVVTFGTGVRQSLRVAGTLAADGVGSRVVDLRWLSPLPVADLAREAAATGRVLVVDETRRSGGVGEGVIAALVDAGFVGAVRRIASADSLIPGGPAAQHVLVGEDAIQEGADALLGR
ncbi:MAG TPA: transketolase C-terminal domain-containing protein, partial [Pilimelia sp.]|nr:transketolase C-terminal domain-containing protein [Pilimelia sp.]